MIKRILLWYYNYMLCMILYDGIISKNNKTKEDSLKALYILNNFSNKWKLIY